MLMSPGACEQAAKRFQALFDRTYARWVQAGPLRRRLEADHIVHLAIPKAARHPDGENAIWERALELLSKAELSLWPLASGGTFAPEPESRVSIFSSHGVRHELYLATLANWAPRLVCHTGPTGYWRMLQWRLEHAGSLKLHRGTVCTIDRSTEPPALEEVPCGDEHLFFKLCRTSFKAPQYRFERPPGHQDDTENWPRGMLPEWYPPGLKVYVDPRQLHLWDRSKPAKCVGDDRLLWKHR